MYRFEFDESGWPVARIAARSAGTVEDSREYVSRWEGWLGRGEPFGVVVVSLHEEQPRTDKEARRLSNRWHKENRERTGRRCVGVAWVSGSSRMTALYRPITAGFTRRMMGCPGRLFAEEKEARAWIEGRLSEVHGAGRG